MSLRKITKRQKTLLIITTIFGLASTHLTLMDSEIGIYIPIMITVVMLLLILWQSEKNNIKAWNTIADGHDMQDELMGTMFDNMKHIAELHITIYNLTAELEKNKAFLKKTTGLTVLQ